MLLHFLTFLCLAATPPFDLVNKETGSITFTPPAGWRLAEKEKLPKSVQVMVVGQGAHEMPPSIYLTTEHFQGSLKDYLEIVKKINRSKGNEWKDLGTLKTGAGTGSLSQADMATEWGEVRMMHLILVHDQTVYNLTAAALKSEFPKFYKEFFNALKSFQING
jgi:hypothetical protein